MLFVEENLVYGAGKSFVFALYSVASKYSSSVAKVTFGLAPIQNYLCYIFNILSATAP